MVSGEGDEIPREQHLGSYHRLLGAQRQLRERVIAAGRGGTVPLSEVANIAKEHLVDERELLNEVTADPRCSVDLARGVLVCH